MKLGEGRGKGLGEWVEGDETKWVTGVEVVGKGGLRFRFEGRASIRWYGLESAWRVTDVTVLGRWAS